MKNWSVTLTVPISETRPTSLRPRSRSMRCSARSFGSASNSSSSALSSCAAAPRAGDRTHGHLVAARGDKNFRARTRDGEAAEIEIIEIGRRIGAAERAIERKRRQREGCFETLRQHRLKNIAGHDVFLGGE